MNGYALAANFRQARHSWRFTSIEADLYHELVAVANERGWPTEFQYSNQLLCATIGTSEKSLIAARNRLKQAGLLDFVSGQKRAPTCYTLKKGLPEVSKSASKKASVSDSISASICDSPLYKELKQKETELEKKLSLAESAASAAQSEAEKKIEELARENETLKAQPMAPHTRPPARVATRKGGKCLMRESPMADFATFAAAFAGLNDARFTTANLKHYHEGLLDWSDANNETKADWLATIRSSMRRDLEKGQLHTNNHRPTQSNGTASNAHQQSNGRYHTTRHAGGFGTFGDVLRRTPPGGVAAQPLGVAAAGGPADVVPRPS